MSGASVSSTAFNTLETDIGTEITNSLDRGGRSAMTAALPMGSQKITGMADPAVATDAATKNYVDTTITTNISLPLPQGYLTPTSNTPIIPGDVLSSANVFYTFKEGGWLPIHNGTTLIPYLMPSQFQLALTSSQAANNIYDIFLAYNANVPVIGTGPSWAAGTGGSVTAGSCARGTGVGGTALARLNGFNVNAASLSLIWNTGSGNTTITVPANQGIYLGSILIDSVAGQVTLHRSYGPSRKWGISNANNRQAIYLKAGDPTASWNYTSTAYRPSNNNTANSLQVFSGLPEEQFGLKFNQLSSFPVATSNNTRVGVGIGVNSITAALGFNPTQGDAWVFPGGSTFTTLYKLVAAEYFMAPSLGINTITALETGSGGGNPTYYGTEQNMVLSAAWRG